MSHLPNRSVLVGGGLYAVVLAGIALWPTHVDDGFDVVDRTVVGRWLLDVGLTRADAYGVMEFGANVALYLPLGLLVVLASARVRWWHAVAVALAVSAVFETLQAVLRPGRTADVTDIVSNTIGAALGATLVVVVRGWRRRRS